MNTCGNCGNSEESKTEKNKVVCNESSTVMVSPKTEDRTFNCENPECPLWKAKNE